MTINGALLLLVGLAGPFRIVVTGAQIPAEVRQALVVHAACFPLAGLSLTVAGVYGTTQVQAAAFFVAGACVLTSSLDELHAVVDKWEGRSVRFLCVYTAEAHPEDGWRLENQCAGDPEYTGNPDHFCFFYAKTADDRRDMAQWLIDKRAFRLPVVLDSMDDTLLSAYNSWPIRLYVIDKGRVVYTGKQGPFGYAPDEVDDALEELLDG